MEILEIVVLSNPSTAAVVETSPGIKETGEVTMREAAVTVESSEDLVPLTNRKRKIVVNLEAEHQASSGSKSFDLSTPSPTLRQASSGEPGKRVVEALGTNLSRLCTSMLSHSDQALVKSMKVSQRLEEGSNRAFR